MKDSTKKNLILAIIFIIIAISGYFVDFLDNMNNPQNEEMKSLYTNKTFKIISSSENQDLEPIVQKYANTKGYNVDFEYAGTLEIMQKLNNGEKYDAVWVSNSIWLYMLDSSVKISESKYTSINPVIFAISKSKANELGFINKTIYTKDLVSAISEGKLKFSMSNPTTTNSGASAYLGMVATLAGNPEVLKADDLQNEELKAQIKTLFSGLERSSGSEEFLEELFLNGNYEAVITYESSIININKQLIEQGKEPLYAIYPVDGVSISDSPFAYIDNGNDEKKEIFKDIQAYILSSEGQKLLQEKGRRTWYGGVSENVDKTTFNPDWGIDTSNYISPVKYPATAVIKQALNLYQTELRKPVHVAFCLDYSGSMYGKGNAQLISAMEYILTEKAAEDFIQFSEKDKIDIIPFAGEVGEVKSATNGNIEELLSYIKEIEPNGATALYPATIEALTVLENEDSEIYNTSIVLMTDGQANVGKFIELQNKYFGLNYKTPIYSITFGSASEKELNQIADMSNAKVFDGKTDLVKAFKEVRGYN